MTNYSHSRISTFEQCRYKYKLQYIDRVKVDIPNTVEAFMGGIVHEALARLYQDLLDGHLMDKRALLVYYQDRWAKQWSDDILIAREEMTAGDYIQKGAQFLADYYDANAPFKGRRVLGLETQDYLRLSARDGYHVRIDRLECDDAGNYFVCDYKTSGRLATKDDVDHDRQLAMYSIWVREQFPDCKDVKLVWHYLAFSKTLMSTRTPAQLAALKAQVLRAISTIESCKDPKEFPTNPSRLCDWCVYKSLCPAFAHERKLEQLPAEDIRTEDGVQLVDRYTLLQDEKRGIEQELDGLRQKLIAYAEHEGIDTVYGRSMKVTVKGQQTLRFPPKEERGALVAMLREAGLFEQVADIDTTKLRKLLPDLPPNVREQLGAFLQKVLEYRVTSAKR
ncbi:hypothetical protein COV94_01775 [Candidatus Woesearchaeota archaeon CG11_big_fil_rev_8_21_14_0_20_57_5]|nr:MAG: hypothetical protein COV94_01775 [Candidatus Woesearchaeota archaeon CG11_big_fil_rev_8_21_14_0_20_57_5]